MSPTVVLALVLGAALSWASPTSAPGARAVPAGSASNPNDSDSYLVEPATALLALALGAPLSTGSSTNGFERRAASTDSRFRNLDSNQFVAEVRDNRPADFDLNVPYNGADVDPSESEDFNLAVAETVRQAGAETPRSDYTRLYPHSEPDPENHQVTLPTSESSSLHCAHPDSAQAAAEHGIGPSPARSERFDRKRKRRAQNAPESSRQLRSVPDNISRAKQVGASYATESPSDFVASPEGLRPSFSRHPHTTRNERIGALLPLLDQLGDIDLLQAEAEKHQVNAGRWCRAVDVNLIPRLSESVQDRIELFAAHYLRYFVSRQNTRLPEADIKYRRNLECLLLCYYGHCGGDLDKFNSRFPKWGQCRFDKLCQGIRQCTYETQPVVRDQRKSGRSAALKKSSSYRGRRVHVHQLLRKISLSANDFQLLQELETPNLGAFAVSRLHFTAAVPMTVVVAQYLRHFGPNQPQKGFKLQDITYRHSLQCMIVCYYEHFGGVDAAFRARYGEFPCIRFYRSCSEKTTCNPNELEPEEAGRTELISGHGDSPPADGPDTSRAESALNDDLDNASACPLSTGTSGCEEGQAESQSGPSPNPPANDARSPVAVASDDPVSLLGSTGPDVDASPEPVSLSGAGQKQLHSWPPHNRYRPWRQYLWSLLEKVPDLDQFEVEAKQHEVQLAPAPDHQKGTRRVPHLSELVQGRVELFAAHYLRYFGPGVSARLCSLDITYGLSLESLLLCFYHHCDGDRVEFDRRHPSWGQCNFHMLRCNSARACNYLEMSERRASYSLKSYIRRGKNVGNSRNSWSGSFRGRSAHVLGLISCRVPSSDYFRQAKIREIRSSSKSAIPRIIWSLGDPIELVLAHFWRYFGPNAAPSPTLRGSDIRFRRSLECLIVCYFEHHDGNETEFRRKCSSLSFRHFYKQCNGKFKCHLRSTLASEEEDD